MISYTENFPFTVSAEEFLDDALIDSSKSLDKVTGAANYCS